MNKMTKQNATSVPQNKTTYDCNEAFGIHDCRDGASVIKSTPIIIPNSKIFDALSNESYCSYDCMDGVSLPTSTASSFATKALSPCSMIENEMVDWKSKISLGSTEVTSVSALKIEIDQLFSTKRAQLITQEELRARLINLLKCVDLSTSELNKYTYWDTQKPYTRNLMATDNENYNLILLCWTPHRESKIHNHPCDTCYLKIIRGTIQEGRYEIDSTNNQVVQTSLKYLSENQGTYTCYLLLIIRITNKNSYVNSCIYSR